MQTVRESASMRAIQLFGMRRVRQALQRAVPYLWAAATLLLLLSEAGAHPVDMEVLAQIESSGNPKAFNQRTKARGLYQITPIVLRQYNSEHSAMVTEDDLFNSRVNKAIANWYLDWLFEKCWTVYDTLIAYNWGIGRWRTWRQKVVGGYSLSEGLSYLPKETRLYIRKYNELTIQKEG